MISTDNVSFGGISGRACGCRQPTLLTQLGHRGSEILQCSHILVGNARAVLSVASREVLPAPSQYDPLATWVAHSPGGSMAKVTYEKEITALLVIDPYNDFLSEGGKLWDHIRAVAEANDCIPHMLQVLNAARKAQLR